jgi:hypothetical protein
MNAERPDLGPAAPGLCNPPNAQDRAARLRIINAYKPVAQIRVTVPPLTRLKCFMLFRFATVNFPAKSATNGCGSFVAGCLGDAWEIMLYETGLLWKSGAPSIHTLELRYNSKML